MAVASLGPIQLAPGVTRGNALTLVVTMFFLGIIIPYINFAQPFILTEHLGIPKERQGVVSGNLAFWTEVVLICLSGLMGAWSDKAGRRLVLMVGLGLVAASYVLYPLAGSYEELLGARMVYAVGMASIGVMTVAIQAEYPAESSRGKLVGLVAMLSIIGVMFIVVVLAPLPARFIGGGATAVEAGRYAYWITAVVAVVATVVAWRGLARHRPTSSAELPFTQRVRLGLTAAQHNPRIALAYGAAFIARADLVVVVVFLSLWITHAGRAQGLTTEAALVQAGIVYGVLQGTALVFAPIMGFITDKLNRVVVLVLATALASPGYLWVGFLEVPMGQQAWPAAALLGMGQVAAILAATALVGQEAPGRSVGAVSGMFTLSGAIGILFTTKFGGWVFDAWMPGAPFVVTGILNGVVMLAALGLIVAGLHRPGSREEVTVQG